MTAFARIQAKIHTHDSIARQAEAWHAAGKRIVFTNGCFDLLHYGHLHYLAEAADLADCLVIGLNSADSVRRLKGPSRPINDEITRLHALAAMEFVAAVAVFDEDTPRQLIERVQPDVLVKGGDWRPEQIVGADWVLARGGKVLSLPFVDGYSTTALERKILSAGI